MRIFVLAATVAASLAGLSSCATVARGTNDTLVVDTVPPGASVSTDRVVGKNRDGSPIYAGCLSTPCEMKIPRRSEFLMTVAADGYQPVEIGVSGSTKKEALRANFATTGKVGVAVGATAFTALASAGGLFSTGAAASAGAATAGVMTGGLLVGTVVVDAATGALLNLNPNPIVITLAPEGTELPEHPKAVAIREKRLAREERRDGGGS